MFLRGLLVAWAPVSRIVTGDPFAFFSTTFAVPVPSDCMGAFAFAPLMVVAPSGSIPHGKNDVSSRCMLAIVSRHTWSFGPALRPVVIQISARWSVRSVSEWSGGQASVGSLRLPRAVHMSISVTWTSAPASGPGHSGSMRQWPVCPHRPHVSLILDAILVARSSAVSCR